MIVLMAADWPCRDSALTDELIMAAKTLIHQPVRDTQWLQQVGGGCSILSVFDVKMFLLVEIRSIKNSRSKTKLI